MLPINPVYLAFVVMCIPLVVAVAVALYDYTQERKSTKRTIEQQNADFLTSYRKYGFDEAWRRAHE